MTTITSKALQKALTRQLEALLPAEQMAPEYEHQWKTWTLSAARRAVPALRARSRSRPGEEGSGGLLLTAATQDPASPERGGWPTPGAGETTREEGMRPCRAATGRKTGFLGEAVVDYGRPMEEQEEVPPPAMTSGWPTPQAYDAENANTPETWYARQQTNPNTSGSSVPTDLSVAAQLAGWETPTALTQRKSARAIQRSEDNGRRTGGGQSSTPGLEQQAELAAGILPPELEGEAMAPTRLALGILPTLSGWPTPKALDHTDNVERAEARQEREGRATAANLPTAAALAGWATPTVGDSKDARNETATRHKLPPTGLHAGQTLVDQVTDAALAPPLSGWSTPRPSMDKEGCLDAVTILERIERLGYRSNVEQDAALTLGCPVDPPLSGWATPTAGDAQKETPFHEALQPALAYQCHLTGWPTPNTGHDESEETFLARQERMKVRHPDKGMGTPLGVVAQLAGWQTPTVTDVQGRAYTYASGDHERPFPTLVGQAYLTGESGSAQMEALAGWATPTSRDDRDATSGGLEAVATDCLLGRQVTLSSEAPAPHPLADHYESLGECQYRCRRCGQTGDGRGPWRAQHLAEAHPPDAPGASTASSTAATARTAAYRLNPGFSAWLQGYDESTWGRSSPGWRAWDSLQRLLADFYARPVPTAAGD